MVIVLCGLEVLASADACTAGAATTDCKQIALMVTTGCSLLAPAEPEVASGSHVHTHSTLPLSTPFDTAASVWTIVSKHRDVWSQ